MATNCSFIKATDARSLARNTTLLWNEVCGIQSGILAAIDAGEYEAIIADGTPMTQINEVMSIVMTNVGAGYTIVEATAAIAHPTGVGAVVTPIVTGGAITSFIVNNTGSGYDPISATASMNTPYDLDDTQDETNFDNVGTEGTFTAGDSYFVGEVITLTDSSTITVDGITGTGFVTVAAQDETAFDGGVGNGTFAGGAGYAALDTITLADGTVITVDAVLVGVVTEFTVTSASTSSYATTGLLHVQYSTSGSGVGFTLTPDVNNEIAVGTVTQFTVDSGASSVFFLGQNLLQTGTTGIGSGFYLTPASGNASLIPHVGTVATLTPIVTSGAITSVVVNAGGTGYNVGNPVAFSHPTGVGATAAVGAVNGSGVILNIIVTTSGSGYETVVPTVTVTHSAGGGFLGTVQESGGIITSISIQDGGYSYNPLYPTATVTSQSGQGATLSIGADNISGGTIQSIDVTNGGFGYSSGDPVVIVKTAGAADPGTEATATATIDPDLNGWGANAPLYYNVISGQSSNRVLTDQIEFIQDYFTALGYNIRGQVNPATASTMQWYVIW